MKPWWLLLICVCLPAAAEEVVFFRCTSANDALTIQNTPCPPGSSQRIQRMPAPPAQVPVQAPASSAATTLEPTALPALQAGTDANAAEAGNAILDSDVLRRQARQQAAPAAPADVPAKLPLPEIYQCQGADGGRYLHEREPAPPHCVLMQVTGLGGNTPANAAGCEVIRDQCQPVPEPQRCSSWQQRFRDARGSERFAAPENRPAATTERERLQALLAASDCAVPD